MTKTLLLCDCLNSQAPDTEALSGVAGIRCSRVHSALCTTEAEAAATAMAGDGEVIVACGQERRRFEEMAEDLGADSPLCVDLRDRAGWSDEGAAAGPKMAALLADALHPAPPVPGFDIEADGTCLILGAPEVALPAARRLSDTLAVTVLLEAPGEELLPEPGFDVVLGRLRGATGALGAFELRIDGLREREPGGRGTPGFGAPRDGARSRCAVILDLRGGTPLFPAPEKRDGYLRADPGRPEAVAGAVVQAADLVGTFEKPLYVKLTRELCAHSRAEKPACSRCLDICPTGAITPAGEHVEVDPLICAGCGACAALCPSGAITAEDPAPDWLFARMRRLAEAYRAAGGHDPRLLVIDRTHGAEMVELGARYGRGLPADVVPMDLERVSGFGHAEMLAALASGFAAVDVVVPPDGERDALDRELALARALSGDGARLRLLDERDPERLCAMFYEDRPAPAEADPVLTMGSRRQVARLAAKALHGATEAPIPLPDGAPYGAVVVDTDACTLCLACASLCPSGALGDNPELPQLRFQEDACLQCGLCVNVCPEDAITLQPRMDLSDAALSQRVLNEEEPFPCIECGKLFGARSTIEKIVSKLEGHSMFTGNDATKLIQMCDDCRVRAQYHGANNPFALGERPRVRTTDDYLSKRRDH